MTALLGNPGLRLPGLPSGDVPGAGQRRRSNVPILLDRYREPGAIAARIEVLLEKRSRIMAYQASLPAGGDGSLLDEKQLRIMEKFDRPIGRPFPSNVQASINRCIDVLQSRLYRLEGDRS